MKNQSQVRHGEEFVYRGKNFTTAKLLFVVAKMFTMEKLLFVAMKRKLIERPFTGLPQ